MVFYLKIDMGTYKSRSTILLPQVETRITHNTTGKFYFSVPRFISIVSFYITIFETFFRPFKIKFMNFSFIFERFISTSHHFEIIFHAVVLTTMVMNHCAVSVQ